MSVKLFLLLFLFFPAILNADILNLSSSTFHHVDSSVIYNYRSHTTKDASGVVVESDSSVLGLLVNVFPHERFAINAGYSTSTANLNEISYLGESYDSNFSLSSKEYTYGFDFYAARLDRRKGGKELSIGLSNRNIYIEGEQLDETLTYLNFSIGAGRNNNSYYLALSQLLNNAEDYDIRPTQLTFTSLSCFRKAYLCFGGGAFIQGYAADEANSLTNGFLLRLDFFY